MPLNVSFKQNEATGGFEVSFGRVLHKRGTDWRLFKNGYDKANGDVFEPSDSQLLKLITQALMQDDAGVVRLDVTPYTIRIFNSPATPVLDLEARVLGAIRRTGATLVRV